MLMWPSFAAFAASRWYCIVAPIRMYSSRTMLPTKRPPTAGSILFASVSGCHGARATSLQHDDSVLMGSCRMICIALWQQRVPFVVLTIVVTSNLCRIARDLAWTYKVLMTSARARAATTAGRIYIIRQTSELSDLCFPRTARLGWAKTSMMNVPKTHMSMTESATCVSTHTDQCIC